MSLLVKDALGATQTVQTLPPLGAAAPAASLPVALAPDQLAGLATSTKQDAVKTSVDALVPLLDGLETLLSGIGAAIISAVYYPATQPVSAAALPLPAGAATATKQDALKTSIDALVPLLDSVETLLGTIGTAITSAVYYPAIQPVSAAALPLPAGAATSEKQDAQAATTAMIGTRAYGIALARVAVANASAQSAAVVGVEVLVHASTRCFIAIGANPVATTNDIPLEAGEKLHLRLTSGHKIAVLRDTTDGFLNVVPVA